MKQLRKLGITRQAAYHGLDVLEAANLIGVERRHGCLPVVTIVNWKTESPNADKGLKLKLTGKVLDTWPELQRVLDQSSNGTLDR
jgi:hypothetical protein